MHGATGWPSPPGVGYPYPGARAPRAGAAIPRPVRTRLGSVAQAVSWGSLAALVLDGALATWWHLRLPIPSPVPLGVPLALGAIGAGIMWIVGLTGRRGRIGLSLLMATEVATSVGASAVLILAWRQQLVATRFPPHHLPPLSAGILAAGALLAGDAVRRWTARHPPPASKAPLRPSAFLTIASATALALVGAAILPNALARTVISTTAPAPAELPTTADTISGELAWTLTSRGALDLMAGAAGPVLVEQGAVRGLDPQDGSTRWSYERPGATIVPIGSGTGTAGERYAVPSPDARHLALRFGIGDSRPSGTTGANHDSVLIVLDTLTGAVTTERMSHQDASLQLTDRMALDGPQALTLDGGQREWALTEPTPVSPSRPLDLGYSGPAGHITFLSSVAPSEGADVPTTTVQLTPDGSRGDMKSLDNVLTDPTTGSIVVVDGWIAQLTDEGASRAAQSSTSSRPGQPRTLGWSTQSVNIDGLATGSIYLYSAGTASPASTSAWIDPTEPVPLGTTSGANIGASRASGDLCLYGERSSDIDMGDAGAHRDELVPVAAALDTATGRVRTPREDPGLASARVGVEHGEHDAGTMTSLVIRPGDGSAGVAVPVEDGSVRPRSDGADGTGAPQQQVLLDHLGQDVAAVSAPGATLLAAETDETGDAEDRASIRLYAVSAQ